MNDLGNSKIRGLSPDWAPFWGLSLLFDNPGMSLRPFSKSETQEAFQIDCSPDIRFLSSIASMS